MTDKTPAMPELPEPELGYIKTDKSNQPAFSARQMRAALQAQQAAKCDGNHGGPRCADPECWNDDPPAQPAAEVSDDDILVVAEFVGLIGPRSRVGESHDAAVRFARAILALRPQAVPMTDEQRRTLVGNYFADAWAKRAAHLLLSDYDKHHRITAPAGGEGV